MADPLGDSVARSVVDLTPVLGGIADESRVRSSRAGADVALEASNIAATSIDVDGLHTDEEVRANARPARNLCEAVVARQASRVVGMTGPTDEQLMALTADDIGAVQPVG